MPPWASASTTASPWAQTWRLQRPEISRVAILDFDVHHGNGTVEIFKDRPEVLVCSSFQHPYYPHRYHDLVREQHRQYAPARRHRQQ